MRSRLVNDEQIVALPSIKHHALDALMPGKPCAIRATKYISSQSTLLVDDAIDMVPRCRKNTLAPHSTHTYSSTKLFPCKFSEAVLLMQEARVTPTLKDASFSEKLKASNQGPAFIVDFVMLLVLVVNLSWLIFDSLFANQVVQLGLEAISSDFFIFYRDSVHPNFRTYDQFFIAIYVTELLIRWAVAIKRQTYYRWFFYPVAHWYDVLGCIPVGSFVWLRLLRIVSIFYRLKKYNLIDLSDTALAATIRKYTDILVEEISDKVVVNVLDGVQDEVRNRHEIVGKITQEAFEPNREDLFKWLSEKITEMIKISYEPNRENIKAYLQDTIDKAADQNQAVATLQKVPVVGDLVVEAIEHLVADLIFQITDQVIADISAADKYQTIEEITDLLSHAIIEEDSEINRILMAILDQSIEIIKDQVKTKEWAIKYGVTEFQ